MPIKLLPKHEINRLQAQEKRQTVEEGLKLANRVENLREIAAKEEASLASFRASTLKAIQKEITEATTERDGLLSQVNILRKELEVGHSGLDVRQRGLEIKESDLLERETTLEKRILALETLVNEVGKREKNSEMTLKRLQNAWQILTEMGQDVLTVYNEAKVALTVSYGKVDTIQGLVKAVEAELKTRDIEVASRERDVTIKEERLDQTAKLLRERELQLIDREQTLEREIKRLKK